MSFNSAQPTLSRSNPEGPGHLSLTSLPLDSLVHVQSFLDPPDILNLRRCSKYCDQVTREKSVWINAVRRIAAHYNVLPSTFPLVKMSLALLEHAATSPSRFLSRLEREIRANGKSLPPFTTRIINRHTCQSTAPALRNSGTFKFLRLAPGGRFLFTATSSGVVELWDLGFTDSAPLPRQSIASTMVPDLVFQHCETTQLLVDRDECGTNLYLLNPPHPQKLTSASLWSILSPFHPPFKESKHLQSIRQRSSRSTLPVNYWSSGLTQLSNYSVFVTAHAPRCVSRSPLIQSSSSTAT
ncbi:hypothetical protein JAAARDRAFT_491789 [Jaapia argillacea MUCL 33604]|uniref:F-box domain-containing protein n=1 Tax=Jaapia argillacea MUCL 33604 TaxID=933084 RepID=A0A067PEC6_9AGAM|nr:hypothetical protein JAAARDRAFT_491789 [Jaapia argillacea MUCL 33604]